MRLWHEALIPYLSTKRLVRQHCECCALRGNGWGRKHATVQYVFNHSYRLLCLYHNVVMDEMQKRGYHVDKEWRNAAYRGKHCKPVDCTADADTLNLHLVTFFIQARQAKSSHRFIYPEHDMAYLEFCIKHLEEKGEHIEWKNTK